MNMSTILPFIFILAVAVIVIFTFARRRTPAEQIIASETWQSVIAKLGINEQREIAGRSILRQRNTASIDGSYQGRRLRILPDSDSDDLMIDIGLTRLVNFSLAMYAIAGTNPELDEALQQARRVSVDAGGPFDQACAVLSASDEMVQHLLQDNAELRAKLLDLQPFSMHLLPERVSFRFYGQSPKWIADADFTANRITEITSIVAAIEEVSVTEVAKSTAAAPAPGPTVVATDTSPAPTEDPAVATAQPEAPPLTLADEPPHATPNAATSD